MSSQRSVRFLRSDDPDGGLPAELHKSEVKKSSDLSGTSQDRQDMYRLGKRQQLDRNFQFLSLVGFTSAIASTWEGELNISPLGLTLGGLAGLIWMYIIAFIGFTATIASLAEMTSMSPTSGGQYHFVSEFAPRCVQKYFSYVTGWVCVLGWHCDTAGVTSLLSTQIQGLLTLTRPNYVFKAWHTSLMSIAFGGSAIFFNTTLAKHLPLVEGIFLLLHVFGFFAVTVTLLFLAPRTPAKEVFTGFRAGGGWSYAMSALIGITAPSLSFIGPDSATHMAEDVVDASVVVPRAMIWAVIYNGLLGLAMLVVFCFSVGNVNDAVNSSTGYPYIAVLFNATQSYTATVLLTSLIIVLSFPLLISCLASTSRQVFAFARDGGLPYSNVISRVHPKMRIPLNAVISPFVGVVLLAIVNIGSSVAYQATVSLTVSALFSSYFISISCIALKRWRNEPLPLARWSLGRFGFATNIIAMVYLAIIVLFSFFPTNVQFAPTTMNWSVIVYFGVILLSTLSYFLGGRQRYRPPVELIKND